MRRESWILAISGMMVIHQSGIAADSAADLATDQPSGRASVIGRTSVSAKAKGSSKNTAAATDSTPKNYYKDLFGEDGNKSGPDATKNANSTETTDPSNLDWTDQSLFSQPALTKTPPTKTKMRSFAPEFDDLPVADLPSASVAPSVVGNEKSKLKLKVSQAAYDRPAGKKVGVQQARSESRPKSAPPLRGIDEVNEKVIRTASAKELNSFDVSQADFDHAKTSGEYASVANGPQTPQVTVEWAKRGEFNVGQECLVDLIVRNTGTSLVSQVAVEAVFPRDVRLTAAEPTPASATDRLTWLFDQLPAGGEQKMTVKMIPSKRANIGATAEVRFTAVNAATFAVQEPLLKVAVKSPTKEVMLGDPASQMITVTNPGTGTAQEVKIEAKLSDGLEHPTREDRLTIDVGNIGPGETRTYRLGLTAAKGGPQSVTVVATSNTDASSSDSVEFNVVAPSLKIAVEGPSLRYKGRHAKYTLTVTNDGFMANNNVRISQIVSEGFKFVAADHNGKFDPSVNTIQWFAGRLEPGESTQVSCDLQSLQIGEFSHAVHVVSDSGVQSEARIDTRIDGIASLTVELIDRDDPVELGSETAYEIRVKNDGSKAATGVLVECELPAGMEFLSTKAPVDRTIEGRKLIFKPIDQIAPGEQVTIQISTKVLREGSHRLRAQLTGGGLPEAMILEEVTRAYSDGQK